MLLRGRITRTIASCSIARLLVLATEEPLQPIVMAIDSPGGSVGEALGVVSTINGIRSPVATFCRGQVVGPAIAVAAHGVKGYRVAVAGAKFRFAFPEEEAKGQGGGRGDSVLPLLIETLVRDTGRNEKEILSWVENGAEFSAEEAVARGLIDKVAAAPLLPKALPG